MLPQLTARCLPPGPIPFMLNGGIFNGREERSQGPMWQVCQCSSSLPFTFPYPRWQSRLQRVIISFRFSSSPLSGPPITIVLCPQSPLTWWSMQTADKIPPLRLLTCFLIFDLLFLGTHCSPSQLEYEISTLNSGTDPASCPLGQQWRWKWILVRELWDFSTSRTDSFT